MNKYEEAYYLIRNEALMPCSRFKLNSATNVFECTCGREEHCKNYVALQTLKELVDKVTPKKPYRGEWGYRCTNCNSPKVYDYEYNNEFRCCSDCGQKLDWSGDDENV